MVTWSAVVDRLLWSVCPVIGYQRARGVMTSISHLYRRRRRWLIVMAEARFSEHLSCFIATMHHHTMMIRRTVVDSEGGEEDAFTHRHIVLAVALVERWTRDRKVAGSTPGPGRYQVN